MPRLALLFLLLLTAGCRDKRLEARVAALELEAASKAPSLQPKAVAAPAAAVKPPALAPNECIGDLAPVQATLAFWAQLDTLMAGYTPPPAEATLATGLDCVTEARGASEAELRPRARRPGLRKADPVRLVQDRDLARRGFLEAYTWADDLTRYRTTRYGCHVLEGGQWTWAAGIAGLDACEGLGAEAVWRVRRAVEVYPEGVVPELMRRMRDAGIVVPARLACWVDDLGKSGLVGCRGPQGLAFGIDLGPEAITAGSVALGVNRGDVVSVVRYGELRRAGVEELWSVGAVPADGLQILQRSTCCGG